MSNEEKKPKRNWGQSQAEYLAVLQGKQVTVAFEDGKALKGELTGLEVMISKGAIKSICTPRRQKTLDTSL